MGAGPVNEQVHDFSSFIRRATGWLNDNFNLQLPTPKVSRSHNGVKIVPISWVDRFLRCFERLTWELG